MTENFEDKQASTDFRVEEETRAQLRASVVELDGFRALLEELYNRLPEPTPEAAMPAGDEELDFFTQARSAIECVLNDSIQPAIRDLATAASYQPKKKESV